MEKPLTNVLKTKSKRLSIRRVKDRSSRTSRRAEITTEIGEDGSESTLPPELHDQLWKMFSQIERAFEKLHSENVVLHDKLDVLTEKYKAVVSGDKPELVVELSTDGAVNTKVAPGVVKKPSASQLMSQKLKTTYKASTSKIVSSLKIPNQAISLDCHHIQQYHGHKDGVWEVTCARNGQPLLGTASADRTARIWSIEGGQCLCLYQAHNGSVNSIRFHPTEQFICTGAGDGSCHIWKSCVSFSDFRSKSPAGLDSPNQSQPGSGDEQDDDVDAPEGPQLHKVKTASVELNEHEGPVVSADWWASGKQIVTASWDRMIKLWDVDCAKVVHTLEGHEMEITHASTHPVQKLIVSSSQDTTFRLWDFRLPSMHSVNVFQGHTDTVTSAVFTGKADHVVSGSDDRTVKVWDLKNMRSPLSTIRLDSAVNRLSISPIQNVIAIPQDNRQVRLFDLNGNRLARLPRRHRQGHQRLVCSASWYDDSNSKNVSLVTAGFDKQVLGWNVMF